ncbi:hypothetical protein H6P81_006519 [Aristolochia fimbriata]|uniref:RRM domain-containing protein n=1 Tax=Aristolochia fimbriata TaxID=158543 RepID=A0AAV7EXJ1_ARIFI|nr:hypothetical protein H6P81_006519 [Aristolochia fimbriata]
MALRAGFRRLVNATPTVPSLTTFVRHNSTLTAPKLFVSGLSRLTTDDKLKEAFAPFGQLVEAKVVTDRASGRSKGFGFVTYTTIEDAEKAKEGRKKAPDHGMRNIYAKFVFWLGSAVSSRYKYLEFCIVLWRRETLFVVYFINLKCDAIP